MKVACLPNVQPDVAANFLYSRLLLSQRHSCQRNPCGKRSFSASLCLVQALWQRIAARGVVAKRGIDQKRVRNAGL